MNVQKHLLVPAIFLLVLMAIGVIGVFGGWNGMLQNPADPLVQVSVAPDSVDPLNNDRVVSVQGNLEFERAATDTKLGVSAPKAVVLFRHVEMYQWQERCIADVCTQSPGWSHDLIDASKFKEPMGHTNPDHFPFESQRFVAEGIRLGAFNPDLELVLAGAPMLPLPVRLVDLPANLAASFSEFEGWIFAGSNSLDPVVGDLRINYRMIPGGTVTLNGKQKDNQLLAVPAR